MARARIYWGIYILAAVLALSGCGPQAELVMEASTETAELEELAEPPVGLAGEVTLLAHYIRQPGIDYAVYRTPAPTVRGIYVSSPRAGSPEYLPDLLTLCADSEANAMVIDVRTEQEATFHGMAIADEMDAAVNNIPDVQKLMATLAENEIYPIARIVAFKDDYTWKTRPELYIKDADGELWLDPQKKPWLNPYNRDAWDYILAYAKAAAEIGFREIQFDYIRFAASERLKDADFGDTEGKSRTEIIEDFARYAVETLRPYGVVVSADVYGTIINSDTDAEIVGQDYAKLAEILDVLCPMIYPSHYAENSMGIDFPDLKPYDTIYKSLEISNERLSAIPEGQRAVIRPWLQDFSAAWLDPHLEYGVEERAAQIRAVYDAGLTEWLLWDPGVHYEAEGMSP